MGQGSRWDSVIYPLKESKSAAIVSPDRVKLTVKSKKETSSRVTMGQVSKWDSVIYPLKESSWAAIVYILKESKWAKDQDGLQLFTP